MTYGVRQNRLLAARMRTGCDGRVKMYRERAWRVALEEAQRRSFLSALIYFVSHSMMALRDHADLGGRRRP